LIEKAMRHNPGGNGITGLSHFSSFDIDKKGFKDYIIAGRKKKWNYMK